MAAVYILEVPLDIEFNAAIEVVKVASKDLEVCGGGA